jgi:hypothetical protein
VTTRSLAARLARLEQHVPAPQGPIVYRVMFHDGSPVWPGPDDGVQAEGREIVYRIASWEETLFDGWAGTARHPNRPGGEW